jgi:hypothetical protein
MPTGFPGLASRFRVNFDQYVRLIYPRLERDNIRRHASKV